MLYPILFITRINGVGKGGKCEIQNISVCNLWKNTMLNNCSTTTAATTAWPSHISEQAGKNGKWNSVQKNEKLSNVPVQYVMNNTPLPCADKEKVSVSSYENPVLHGSDKDCKTNKRSKIARIILNPNIPIVLGARFYIQHDAILFFYSQFQLEEWGYGKDAFFVLSSPLADSQSKMGWRLGFI